MNVVVRSLLFGCLLAPLIVHAEERRLDKTFTVSPGGKVTVDVDGGDVVVNGGSSNQVVVQIVLKGSRDALEKITLSAEQQGNDVAVKAKREWTGWFNGFNQQTTVTVTVPKKYGTDLRTSGGNIVVKDVEGDAVGKTSGGDIRVGAVQGTVRMSTSGGSIEVENVTGQTDVRTSGGDIRAKVVTGDLRAETSGGSIRIEQVAGAAKARTSSGDVVARDVRGPADLQTSGGSIDADAIDGSIRAVTSGGDVKVDLVGANRGIVATTNGGSVTVRVPRNVTASVDASTSGGSVSTDLPVTTTEVRERRLAGTINGGGASIQARSSGGDVRLRARD